jgi:maltose-binding protein MalE
MYFCFKKLNIIIWIISLSCITMLWGCNDKESPDNQPKTNITIWMDSNDKEMEFQKKVAKIYEDRNPEIKINLKFINFVDLKPKFIGQVNKKSGPDIIFLVNDWIGELVEKKLIRKMEGEFSQYIPRTLQSVQYKDEVYALPRNFEVITLFYNKNLVPVPPINIKQLIDTGLRLKKKGIFGLMYDFTDFYYHAPWLYGFGSRIFKPDGQLDTDSLKRSDSYKLILDLKDKYRILPQKVNQSAMINMFNSGQVAMIIAGPWSLGDIERNNINYGLSLLPVLENGNRLQPFVGVKGFAVTTTSRYPEESKKVIEFFTGSEIQKMAMKELDVLPCVQSIYEDEKVPERINGFYKQAKFGTPMPTYAGMKFIWRDFNWAISRIFAADKSPEVGQTSVTENKKQLNYDKKIDQVLEITVNEINRKIISGSGKAENKL